MTATSITTTSRTSYIRDNKDVEYLVEEVIPKDSFYRVEKMTRKTKNDGAWMNFPSVSLFSSVANADLTKFFRQLGCESSTNAYSITGSTPLVNSLFSVRYGLYSELAEEYPLLTYLGESGKTYLYENACTLPLGFWLPPELEENFLPESGTPAEVQNSFTQLCGCGAVLTDAWGETNGQTFRFVPESDGDYYVYVINKDVKKVTVSTDGESKSFDHVDRGYFLELGWCRAGVEVTITSEDNKVMDARAYRFEEGVLQDVYHRLGEYGLVVTSWQDTLIKGYADTPAPGTFFTSIPYDQGWKIMLDGREVKGKKVFDTFLGFELPGGSHEITLTYRPPGLIQGFWISLVSIILIGLAGVLCLRKPKAQKPQLSGRQESEGQKQDREEPFDGEAFLDEDFSDKDFPDKEFLEEDFPFTQAPVRPEGAIEDLERFFEDDDMF